MPATLTRPPKTPPTVESSLSPSEILSFQKTLAAIQVKGRGAEYDAGIWAGHVAQKVGFYAERAMISQLGLEPGEAKKYLRRMTQVQEIPDRNFWVAIDCKLVLRILKLEPAARTKCVQEILEARNRHGVTPKGPALRILRVYTGDSAAAEPQVKIRKVDGPAISRALMELRSILENPRFQALGIAVPPDVVQFLRVRAPS